MCVVLVMLKWERRRVRFFGMPALPAGTSLSPVRYSGAPPSPVRHSGAPPSPMRCSGALSPVRCNGAPPQSSETQLSPLHIRNLMILPLFWFCLCSRFSERQFHSKTLGIMTLIMFLPSLSWCSLNHTWMQRL